MYRSIVDRWAKMSMCMICVQHNSVSSGEDVTPLASLASLTRVTRGTSSHFTAAMKRLERNPEDPPHRHVHRCPSMCNAFSTGSAEEPVLLEPHSCLLLLTPSFTYGTSSRSAGPSITMAASGSSSVQTI